MTDDARDRARASALDASSSSSSRPWTLAVASRAHVAAVKSVDVARARADGATTVVSASADGDALARRRRGATWEPLARLRGHDGGGARDVRGTRAGPRLDGVVRSNGARVDAAERRERCVRGDASASGGGGDAARARGLRDGVRVERG